MLLRLIHICLLCFITVGLSSQQLQQNGFIAYTTAQGLSHNYVSEIKEDSTGYIWIATQAGLNRFNGNQFVQYHSSNDNRSLPAEELTGAAWLDKYRLAFYSSGLHIVNTKTGNTQNLFIRLMS